MLLLSCCRGDSRRKYPAQRGGRESGEAQSGPMTSGRCKEKKRDEKGMFHTGSDTWVLDLIDIIIFIIITTTIIITITIIIIIMTIIIAGPLARG